MTAVLSRPTMGRKGGPSAEGPTKSVRLYAEEGEMAYWLGEVTGKSTAAIMRPICRPGLSALYEQHRPAIERLQKMRAEEQRLKEEQARRMDQLAPVDPPPPPPTPRRRRQDES